MTRRKFPLYAALAIAALLAPRAAVPTNATGTFTAAANVAKSCTMTSPTDVNLGAYNPFGSGTLTGTTSIRVKCVKGTGYTIALSSANGFRMDDGIGNYIPYAIKQPNNTTNWETTPLVVPGSSILTNQYYSYTARVSVTQGLGVPLGTYADVVTVTVTY